MPEKNTNPVAMTVACLKVYYVNDADLVRKIDELIAEHGEPTIKTLGENRPPKPPGGGGQ